MSFGGAGGSGGGSIAGASDVNLSSVQNNQVLGYNTAISKWENQSLPTGGGSGSGFVTVGLAGSGATWIVDNTAGAEVAINDALQSAGVNGAVYLLAGVYQTKAPVLVGDRQALIGAGPSQSLLSAASGFSGQAVVRTPVGFTGTRVVVQGIAVDANSRVSNGILIEANAKPAVYAPDPMPIISQCFVLSTTGDGFALGGSYGGACREFHISDCRAQDCAGWGFNLNSSDGFTWGCSVQGGGLGGYWLNGGNQKMSCCKVYSAGEVGAPAPGFKISSSRGTISGCEAQDCYGNGYEITGSNVTISGCTADSNGDGANASNSAGFYVSANQVFLTGSSYQRSGGGAVWKDPAAGQMYALRVSGGSRLYGRLVTSDAVGPWVGNLSGTLSGDSDVKFT